MDSLFDKLSRKTSAEFHGESVQPGWVKYSWNDSTWNLDDGENFSCHYCASRLFSSADSDYQIFVWRQKSSDEENADSSPVLHVRNPEQPLPQPPAYQNPSFYQFKPKPTPVSPPRSHRSADRASLKSAKSKKTIKEEQHDAIPQHQKDFEKYQSENGVRTISGDIGPVKNGRIINCTARYISDASLVPDYSPNALKERLSSCLSLPQIRPTTWIHPSRRHSWTLWLRWFSQVILLCFVLSDHQL